jgi:hypothetical protein
MCSFEATVEAIVSERSIAVAVAGLLMKHSGDLCGHLVGSHLIGMRKVQSCELFTAKDPRKWLGGRLRVIGRNIGCGIAPLSRCGHSDESEGETPKDSLHLAILNKVGRFEAKKGGTNVSLSVPGGQ